MNKPLIKSLAAVAAALATQFAHADLRDFRMLNSTAWTIQSVYIAETDARNWGREVLGESSTLGAGGWTDITFTGGSSCVSDIRVVFNENVDLTWKNVNLCKTAKMTIWYDYGSKSYKAQWN